MADIKLFIGGCPNPLFPNDNGYNYYREPHATRVAYEYANGEFTLGWPLSPMAPESQYQRAAINDGDLAVGDHIMMYPVPEVHVLREVLVRVDNPDVRFVGAALKPSAMMYDATTKTYTEDPVLDTLFGNIVLDTASITYAHIPDDPYFVPKGKTLVISWKVVALPTDTTLKFSGLSACASIISKVGGFDIPTHV